MDWGVISGISAAAMATGAVGGALGKHFYTRGRQDGAAKGADLANAAAIVRIEMSIDKLTTTVNQHLVEDAEKFARLETLTTATADAMKAAAQEMRALTERLDRAISGRP